jgi:hypothetical protein
VSGQTYFVRIVARNDIGGGTSVAGPQSSGAPNVPPSLSVIGNQETDNTSIAVNFTLTDPDHVLTCTGAMSATSSNATVVPVSNIVFSGTLPNCVATITAATNQSGTSEITLTANDGISTSARTFNMTFLPCTVASIVWETQPTGMAAGNLFGTAPRVSLRRANNTLCTNNFEPVSLEVSTDNSNQQDATVTSGESIVPSGGYAHFTAARMTRAGTGYRITASQGEVSSTESSTFNVTALAGSKLVFQDGFEPNSTPVSAVMLPNPIVRLADIYDNYLTTSGVSVTVSLQDNDEGATLGGTLSRNTTAAGATFNNLTVNRAGRYFLRASATGYTAVNSDFFDVLVLVPVDTHAVLDMLHGPLQHTSGSVNYRRAGFNLGTNFIDGTTTYTWSIVATNTSGSNATVRFRRGSTTVSSISVPTGTTVPTRFTAPDFSTPGSTGANFMLRVEGGGANVTSSRINIRQQNATKTQVVIPLTSIAANASPAYLATTSTTHVPLADANNMVWQWDPDQLDRINTALFQVNFSGTGGSCYSLWDKTNNLQIGTDLCTTATAENTVSQSLTSAQLPNYPTELEFRMRRNGATEARVFAAYLIVRLTSIRRSITIQRSMPTLTAQGANANFDGQRVTSFRNRFGTASVTEYLNCRARALDNGSASLILRDHLTNDSGTTPTTNITGSTINLSSQGSSTHFTTGPLSTTAGNHMFMSFNWTSGTFEVTGCQYVHDAVYP